MVTSARIVDALKRTLKARGMTYNGLAHRLDLSESAVKHMFSTGNFSLKRLDEVCAVLELDIGDLVTLGDTLEPKIEQLSVEHEAEIVADIRLLLVAYCLINYWTFDEIVDYYEISQAEGLRYLRRLDRMKVIELQPGDRVRLLIANNFAWRKNGAIEQFFRKRVQTEFLSGDFTDDGAVRIVKNGMLSKKSQLQLVERLKVIGDMFDDATWSDRKLPVADKVGVSMVVAMRDWFFRAFTELER